VCGKTSTESPRYLLLRIGLHIVVVLIDRVFSAKIDFSFENLFGGRGQNKGGRFETSTRDGGSRLEASRDYAARAISRRKYSTGLRIFQGDRQDGISRCVEAFQKDVMTRDLCWRWISNQRLEEPASCYLHGPRRYWHPTQRQGRAFNLSVARGCYASRA
jgi:hypothetical protein